MEANGNCIIMISFHFWCRAGGRERATEREWKSGVVHGDRAGYWVMMRLQREFSDSFTLVSWIWRKDFMLDEFRGWKWFLGVRRIPENSKNRYEKISPALNVLSNFLSKDFIFEGNQWKVVFEIIPRNQIFYEFQFLEFSTLEIFIWLNQLTCPRAICINIPSTNRQQQPFSPKLINVVPRLWSLNKHW